MLTCLNRSLKGVHKQLSLLSDGHRFGQVARLVNIVPSQDGQVVAEQLQRHNIYYGLQAIRHLGYLHSYHTQSTAC